MMENVKRAAERVANECIGLRSRHLGRVITRLYDQALRDQGLTAPQLSLLAAVELLAPVPASGLVDPLEMDKSTLSRNLRLMKRHGWIREVAVEGRARQLSLTAQGREALLAAMPAWEDAQNAARERLGAGAGEVLDKLLGHPWNQAE